MPLWLPNLARGLVKPLAGTPLNRTHPLVNGLLGFWPLNGGGTYFRDALYGLTAAQVGAGIISKGGLLTDVTADGSQVTAIPARFSGMVLPFTLGFRARVLASSDNYATVCGIRYTNTNTNPYNVCLFYIDAGGTLYLSTNDGGSTHQTLDSTLIWSSYIDKTINVIGTFTATTRTIYLNGVLVVQSSGSYPNPAFGASPLWAMGQHSGGDGSPHAVIEWAGIWKRERLLSEIKVLTAAPYQMFAPPAWQRWPMDVPAGKALPPFQRRWRHLNSSRLA